MFNKKIIAWHKLQKQMFKVSALDFVDNTATLCPFVFDEQPLNCSLTHVDLNVLILSQDSGLEDDNKLSVFEGDLIKFEDVIFELKYGWYGMAGTGNNEFGWHLANPNYNFKYVGGGERVGNIHEHTKEVN